MLLSRLIAHFHVFSSGSPQFQRNIGINGIKAYFYKKILRIVNG